MRANVSKTVGAMSINSNGMVLLCLRAPTKKAWSGCWDIAGNVEDGGSLEEALVRESREEVGRIADIEAARAATAIDPCLLVVNLG